jgi:hypothetical protein
MSREHPGPRVHAGGGYAVRRRGSLDRAGAARRGANVAFGPARNDFQPGKPTGILLSSPDPAADRTELESLGVDVDPDVMGGGGGVPVMFSFRDQDKNQLMIVQEA